MQLEDRDVYGNTKKILATLIWRMATYSLFSIEHVWTFLQRKMHMIHLAHAQ